MRSCSTKNFHGIVIFCKWKILKKVQLHGLKKMLFTLNKMKDGVLGTVEEMLNASGEAGLELFIKLFNNIVKEEKVPSDWEMNVIINCFKRKGDAVERGNFRGLKLLDHLMKVFESD